MNHIIRIHQFGGTEVLTAETQQLAHPDIGEVLLAQKGIAVHYADTMLREGNYYLKPELPTVIGLDGAGVIEAIGPQVESFAIGDKACYAFTLGAYAERRIMSVNDLIKVPKDIDLKSIAGTFTRAMTAQYLLHQAYKVNDKDIVLIHAAAGGVGSLLCQWAKALGAMVIGTVTNDEKREIAIANGATYVINSQTEDLVSQVNKLTHGKGISVVYDCIGKDVWEVNVAALRPTGTLINYGHLSGQIPPINPMQLNAKSLFFGKVSLPHFMNSSAAKQAMANDVFAAIASGILNISISQEYSLKDVAQAHSDIVNRKTTGSVILIP